MAQTTITAVHAYCVFELVGLASTMKAAAVYVRRCGRIIVIGEEAEFPNG